MCPVLYCPPEALPVCLPTLCALQAKSLQDLQLEGLLQPSQAVAFQQQAAAYPDLSPQGRRQLCDRIMKVWDSSTPQASSSGAAQPSAGASSPAAVRGSSRYRQAPAAAACCSLPSCSAQRLDLSCFLQRTALGPLMWGNHPFTAI